MRGHYVSIQTSDSPSCGQDSLALLTGKASDSEYRGSLVAASVPQNCSNSTSSTYIDRHSCDADPLLHDLQPDDQLHTTPGVQLSTADAKEHGEVGVGACSLALVYHNVLDILKFCLSSDSIFALAATQTAEDVSRFLISSGFRQPARALWEEPTDPK